MCIYMLICEQVFACRPVFIYIYSFLFICIFILYVFCLSTFVDIQCVHLFFACAYL